MRYQGTITKWKDEEGYGFITPRGGGKQVFLHIKAFNGASARPVGDEVVTYEVSQDDKGRERATSVRYVGQEESEPSIIHSSPGIQWAVFVILGGLFATSALSRLPYLVPVAVLAMSLIAYAAYAIDKFKAQNNLWRVSEATLHLMALLGGWPGAMLAQHQLRHKLRKSEFMLIFWVTVALNCLAIALLSSPLGEAIPRLK